MTKNKDLYRAHCFETQNLHSMSSKHMDMFTEKCNKLSVKISPEEEKQNYKQTHITVASRLEEIWTLLLCPNVAYKRIENISSVFWSLAVSRGITPLIASTAKLNQELFITNQIPYTHITHN